MIEFNNLNKATPYLIFKKKYDQAFLKKQEGIEAISISTFNKKLNEVNSRYVNLKFVNNDQFIFFTNYNSPKSEEILTHNQISALIFWSSLNIQIRIRAKINKTSKNFNYEYFKKRNIEKNALAISSNQSKVINSYSQVVENYNRSLKNDDLLKCPDNWGGYAFTPYYFEFWEGHESRINKREVFYKTDGAWIHSFLQP